MHANCFLAILVFSIMFLIHFRKQRSLRILIAANMCIGVAMSLVDAIAGNGIWETATLGITYASVSITVYALIYFYYLFKTDQFEYTRGHPMFWLSIGCLVYFGVNTLYFMVMDQLINKYGRNEVMGWGFHNLLIIIANCFYARAFRCFRNLTTVQ